jgi:GT2 family glycosyltransferase
MEAVDLIWTGPPRRRFDPAKAPAGKLPKVSIHLAICREPPDMVQRTLRALAALDYPDFEVIVVDNNTGDAALWRPVEAACRILGPRFRFLHRNRLAGFKGGALNLALEHCAPDAEIIAVIDSDYEVARDWLRALTPLFEAPEIAVVQAPQDYRDGQDTAFKTACYWEYAGFFRIGMVRRNEADAIIQHGTMSLIRRTALIEAGGWAQWCITEDAELGLRLAHRGWQSAYIAQSFGRGLTPDSLAAYKAQRFRWVYGAMQILKRRWRWLIGNKNTALTPAQRFHYLADWLPWIADAAGLLFTLGALIWTATLVWQPETGPPPAAFLGPVLTAFAFRQWRLWKLYAHAVPCSARERRAAALAGLALSHSAAMAVICGLVTHKRPFRRTPKRRAPPSLAHALTMAAQESVLVVLLGAAIAAFALTQSPFGLEAWLWIAVLAVMALPYGATLMLALLSARSRTAPRHAGLAPPVPAYPPGERRRRRKRQP